MRISYRDITGIKFGLLTPVSIDFKRIEQERTNGIKYPPTYWLCKCDCGNENLASVRIGSLQSGATTSCGCKAYENITKIKDLTGQIFGKLTVIKIDNERINNEVLSGKRKKIYWLCKCSCGNPNLKSIWSSHLKDGRIVSCGCELTNKLSVENNWTLGNLTNKDTLIRNSKEYGNWRNSVFERDRYTCQCCGKIGGKLNAHHIENFAEHLELRFDLNNGITLCDQCHDTRYDGSFHNIYGTRHNTKEQLIEYIQYKRVIAVNNGYFYLEIPFWTEKDESYKQLIDNKIKEINKR
jgi:hypothetical protein